MSTRDRLSRLTAELLKPAQAPAVAALAPVPQVPDPSGPPAPHVAESVTPTTTAAVSDGVAPGLQPPALETRFPGQGARPAGRRTGPGEMLAFRGQMLAAEGEVNRLRGELAQFDGAWPTRQLDARQVVPSRWANRHPASFDTPEFLRFKSDIEQAGGNVQPILVRPLAGEGERWELVFGHRRHQACLQLGLPVLAAIHTGPLSDADLFAAMDRENRERADLSPWEQGTMYQRALDEQMFGSQRRLAEALGVSHTWVRKAIAVADLPEPVVQCFRTPLELSFRAAEEIHGALQQDRKGVLRRAEKLRQSERQSASAVVATLVGRQRGAQPPLEIRVGGELRARLTWDARGQAVLRFQPGAVHQDNQALVLAALQRALDTGTPR